MPDAELDALDPRDSDERWRVMIDGTAPKARIFIADEARQDSRLSSRWNPQPVDHFGYGAYLSAHLCRTRRHR